jgi:hypothetical protein
MAERKPDDQFGSDETDKRFDKILRGALNTPPMPRKDDGGKKPTTGKRTTKKA